jgi:hypothetical protein
MKPEFKDIAYRLTNEVNHFGDYGLDWSEDIEILKFEGYWSGLDSSPKPFGEPVLYPNPIIFTGFWDVVQHIDFPNNYESWNVMSKKMYETLLSIGNFPHRLIPMVVIDWQVQPWDWFEESTITKENAYQVEQTKWYKMGKRLKKDIIHNDFVLIEMHEHIDILDYENSVIEYDEDEPKEIRNINKYVFKIPEDGLPPLFKVKPKGFELFISTEARLALKKAGICGTRYIPLDGNQNKEVDIDVPIILPK